MTRCSEHDASLRSPSQKAPPQAYRSASDVSGIMPPGTRSHTIAVLVIAAVQMSACGRSEPLFISGSDAPRIPATPPTPAMPPSDMTDPPDRTDPLAPVRLTVFLDDRPAPDIDVLFSNPDGSIQAQHQTSAEGTAASLLMPGGFVSAFVRDASRANTRRALRLYTYANVEPGDRLQLKLHSAPQLAALGRARITRNAYPASRRMLYDLGCSSGRANLAEPVEVDVYDGCLTHDGTFSVVARFRGSDFAYGYRTGVPLDRSFGAVTPVEITEWSEDFTRIEIALTGSVPAGVLAHVETGLLVNGVRFDGPNDLSPMIGPRTNLRLDAPLDFATGIVIKLSVGEGTIRRAIRYRTQRYSDVTQAPLQQELNIDTALMPPIRDVEWTWPDGPEVTWQTEPTRPDLEAQGTMVLLAWEDENTEGHEWLTSAAPGISRLRLPVLPEALRSFAPKQNSNFTYQQVIAVRGDFIDDPDMLRQEYGPALLDLDVPPTGQTYLHSVGGEPRELPPWSAW